MVLNGTCQAIRQDNLFYVDNAQNIDDDFAKVSEKICKQTLTLPHKNKTQPLSLKTRLKTLLSSAVSPPLNSRIQFKAPKKAISPLNYKEYYDSETLEITRLLYAKDIELFNYTF